MTLSDGANTGQHAAYCDLAHLLANNQLAFTLTPPTDLGETEPSKIQLFVAGTKPNSPVFLEIPDDVIQTNLFLLSWSTNP